MAFPTRLFTVPCPRCGGQYYVGMGGDPGSCGRCRLQDATQSTETRNDGSGRPAQGRSRISVTPPPVDAGATPPTPTTPIPDYARMTGGDLEAHQRALYAAVGAGGMVAGLGGERPVVSVIRAALEAALAHWDDLGLDAATSGYQAEGSEQYGEAERQAHAEILPLINEIYDRSRDVLHARLDADDHRRVLSEGALARIAARDAGVETDMDVGCSRGQETIMLQVLAVQHIADQDDMWRQRLQVTDGATRMVACAYSHHHDALADSLHAVITVTEWTWLLDATEAGRGGGHLVLTRQGSSPCDD